MHKHSLALPQKDYKEYIGFFKFIQKSAEKLFYKTIDEYGRIKSKLMFKSFTACLKAPFENDQVILARNKEKRSSLVKGLIRCKSKVCPICSAIIFKDNYTNLKKAINKHLKDENNSVYLLTLTIPHQRTDKLKELIDKFDKAKQDFWRSGTVKNFRKSSGLVGRVTSLEVNYNDNKNGYHPHYHVLLFCKKIEIGTLRRDLQQEWQNVTNKQGLKVSLEIGLSIEDGRKINDYMTKLANEITGSQIKETRNGGLTMWGLARSAYATGNIEHLRIFFTIAEVLKGKRMIHWSKGLKAHFSLEDLTDDEIMAKEENEHESVFLISYADHKRTEQTGHDVKIRNLLANDQLVVLEKLLKKLNIDYIDLRKEKDVKIHNMLLNPKRSILRTKADDIKNFIRQATKRRQ